MNKPAYEIPVTHPAQPPFGVPGAAGAMPPTRGELPPELPGPAVDYSQLPPPAVMPVEQPSVPAPPATSPPRRAAVDYGLGKAA